MDTSSGGNTTQAFETGNTKKYRFETSLYFLFGKSSLETPHNLNGFTNEKDVDLDLERFRREKVILVIQNFRSTNTSLVRGFKAKLDGIYLRYEILELALEVGLCESEIADEVAEREEGKLNVDDFFFQ